MSALMASGGGSAPKMASALTALLAVVNPGEPLAGASRCTGGGATDVSRERVQCRAAFPKVVRHQMLHE